MLNQVKGLRQRGRGLTPSWRGKPFRPTRWRPVLEPLEEHLLLNASNLVVSAAVAPTTLISSQSAHLRWDVTNRGTEAANASWVDRVYLLTDDAIDGADALLGGSVAAPSTLGPGESYTQDQSITVPAADSGNYYLLFATNSDGAQDEATTADNIRAVPITLVGSSGKLPDLVVTAATAPTSAEVGPIDVSWTVKNQGTGKASGFWGDTFYLSKDNTYDSSDTSITTSYHDASLDPGTSQSFDATLYLPSVAAGNYYLLIVADGSHYVSESDESNNVFALPIALTVPDVRPGRDGGRSPQYFQVRLERRRLLDGDQPGDRLDDGSLLVRLRLSVDRRQVRRLRSLRD